MVLKIKLPARIQKIEIRTVADDGSFPELPINPECLKTIVGKFKHGGRVHRERHVLRTVIHIYQRKISVR